MADPNTTRNSNGRLNNSVVPEGYERNVVIAAASPADTAQETRDGHAGLGRTDEQRKENHQMYQDNVDDWLETQPGAPNDKSYNEAGSGAPNGDTAHCLGGCQPTEHGGFQSSPSQYPQVVKDDDVEDGRGLTPPNGNSAHVTAPSGN